MCESIVPPPRVHCIQIGKENRRSDFFQQCVGVRKCFGARDKMLRENTQRQHISRIRLLTHGFKAFNAGPLVLQRPLVLGSAPPARASRTERDRPPYPCPNSAETCSAALRRS